MNCTRCGQTRKAHVKLEGSKHLVCPDFLFTIAEDAAVPSASVTPQKVGAIVRKAVGELREELNEAREELGLAIADLASEDGEES